MAFKMKSGNSPKFKMIGSSPFKQDDDLGNAEELIKARTEDRKDINAAYEARAKLDGTELTGIDAKESANAGANRILDGVGTDVDHAKSKLDSEINRKLSDNAPWSEKAKSIQSDHTKQDKWGEGGERIQDPSGYDKTDAELKLESDTRKEAARTNNQSKAHDGFTTENKNWLGGNITKAEKHNLKSKDMLDKYKQAVASGESGVSFNWRNIFGGDGISGGFKVEPKRDILQRKIEKRALKKIEKDGMKKRKAELKNAKKERRSKTTVGKVQNALTQATDWVGNITNDKVVATSTKSGKKVKVGKNAAGEVVMTDKSKEKESKRKKN
jgi:hypothetical protein